MKNGNISNISAPSIIIDGVSLFEKKIIKYLEISVYIQKILRCAREVNITVFLEKNKLPLRILENSRVPYYETILKPLNGMVWYLRRKRCYIFASKERAKLFGGRAYLLDGSVKDIIGEAK